MVLLTPKLQAKGLVEAIEMRPDEAVVPSTLSIQWKRVKRQSLDETEDEHVQSRRKIPHWVLQYFDESGSHVPEWKIWTTESISTEFWFAFDDVLIRKHCITLNDLLPDGNEDVLCYMHSRLDEVFQKVTIALHNLLTAPITVASVERSFSKLMQLICIQQWW